MIFERNGMRIFYEIKGAGRPMILLHGNGEDHTIFNEASEVLSKRYTCILPDSRGHGNSVAVKELHYSDMADDMIGLIEELDLNDVVFYGFSDGGIIGLLASMKSDRITDLIVSGANLTPEGIMPWTKFLIQTAFLFTRDSKLKLMLKEPHITVEQLSKIKARTLVLAGSRDAVKQTDTEQIAHAVPGAVMRILEGEDHGSYIIHSRVIADLLMEWLNEK